MVRKFTAEDLARILCVVSPFTMLEALEIRRRTCLTQWEWLIELLDMFLSFLPLLPTTQAVRTLERVLKWYAWLTFFNQSKIFPHYPPIRIDSTVYDLVQLPPWPGT